MTTPLAPIRLGVNIDHVATLRNARGGRYPDPLFAAQTAQNSGADGITVHLREDRRHIRDTDVYAIKKHITLPLNLEMAATDDMLAIALDVIPHACCIVPENRLEITTEGGLDAINQKVKLKKICDALHDKNIRVSLFIDPILAQVDAAHEIGADIVEFHTGTYCNFFDEEFTDQKTPKTHAELRKIVDAVTHAHACGIEPHAGHGLTFENVASIAAIPAIAELNIGHFLIAQSIFTGLSDAIVTMKHFIESARDVA